MLNKSIMAQLVEPTMYGSQLKNFYIPEQQSIYLLSTNDSKKLRQWIGICQKQLNKLGYDKVELLGSGAYGFAFKGEDAFGRHKVFKFSRITLPASVRERLREEAEMMSYLSHPLIPTFHQYVVNRSQGIIEMDRGVGIDLEQYSLRHGKLTPRQIIDIAAQLADILKYLRTIRIGPNARPIVHGDIKPSNLTFYDANNEISLIDWGSSVFAQVDCNGEPTQDNIMDLLSNDLQSSNSRLGDVYFIGPEQMAGDVSSPRFDEQGVASTLYALASNQGSRYGRQVIPARSLGLPREFAEVLDNMLDPDPKTRAKAGDYFIKNMSTMRSLYLPDIPMPQAKALLPIHFAPTPKDIDTVVYSSRKSFLMEDLDPSHVADIKDVQLEHYYKNYLAGMGENEKAFLAAVSRLGKFPVVGGLVIKWGEQSVSIDSSLSVFDKSLEKSFSEVVDNLVYLARAIQRNGIFKACLFDAKRTIHLDRKDPNQQFLPKPDTRLAYEKAKISSTVEKPERMHSYFEDGQDPDELLTLPDSIIDDLERLNVIHHTGCIIFEVFETHMKIHNYYKLLDLKQEAEFVAILESIIQKVPLISGLGVSGFMKLPYRDTKTFSSFEGLYTQYYPKNPKQYLTSLELSD